MAHLAAAVDGVAGLPGAPRWTPAERWHVTLAFLGEVGESTMDNLMTGLGAVEAPVLELSIAGAGTFPDRGAPRVMWAGLTGDLPALTALAKQARGAARHARIRLDRKPFRPHLTLGRWRPGDPADQSVARALADYRGPEFEIASLALMRSHLGPDPRHEALHSWPLGRREKCRPS